MAAGGTMTIGGGATCAAAVSLSAAAPATVAGDCDGVQRCELLVRRLARRLRRLALIAVLVVMGAACVVAVDARRATRWRLSEGRMCPAWRGMAARWPS